MKAGTGRLETLDIARGIAILSIILGHSGNKAVEAIVFTYHVPIFVLLSGCFLNTKGSWSDFLKKKVHTLLLPYLITSLLVILLAGLYNGWLYGIDTALESMGIWLGGALYGSGVNVSQPFEVSRIGAIWFLLALFESQLFARALFKLPKYLQPLAVACFVLAGALVPKGFYLPFSLKQSFIFVLYLYLGHLGFTLWPLYQKWPAWIKVICMLISFLGLFDFIWHFKGFALVSSFFGRGAVDIVESLCACLAILYLSAWLAHIEGLGSFLGFLGRNSIVLLCLHTIELNVYPWLWFWDWISSFNLPLELCQLLFSLLEICLDCLLLFVLVQFRWFRLLFGLEKGRKERSQIQSSI